jgi:ABC-type cobalamin/Fe3+-siderophores transport system ATPase subunit
MGILRNIIKMTAISLPLPVNVLHTEPQTLEFDKIVTFIGGNGSGKSSILKSIFEEKLKAHEYQEYKIVCFSSGQNENYSELFRKHLNKERLAKKALSLDCFYYDKLLSKLLIFIATISKHEGWVRSYLRQNSYVSENDFDEDETTTLTFDVKVGKGYISTVKNALDDEVQGDTDVITNKAYHRTLYNFINSLIIDGYEFEEPLKQHSVQLTQGLLADVSFETDNEDPFNLMAKFFTQAADNDYFIIKDSLNLTITKTVNEQESIILRLEELSDGEYQLLFLYSLIDLFDTQDTLFLFDEADSHLHYKNIEQLWNVYKKIEGSIITTTHLLDSIVKAGPKNLRVIENGEIDKSNSSFKLVQRLESLSDVEATQYKVVSMYKNVVVMDHVHDWEIFKLLVIRKLGPDAEADITNRLSEFICISVSSGFKDDFDKSCFGDNKINWLKNYERVLTKLDSKTERVFLICDRDDLPISLLGTAKAPFLPKTKNFIPKTLKQKKKENSKVLSVTALLSWRRREIKHYLISNTALGEDCVEINKLLLDVNKLKKNDNGDFDRNGSFNNDLAKLKSKSIKSIVDSHVNIDGEGFCVDKTKSYIDKIPVTEISDDIVNMYNYLVANNE